MDGYHTLSCIPSQREKTVTDEQLDVFMKVIAEDEIWCDFFYTELTTGLRRGEICGLKWEDFDEVAGTLKVCRTVYRETGSGLTAGNTKTSAGTRKIVLPSSTAALLSKRKASALTEWIFPNPLKPEQPTNPGAAYRQLKVLLRRAGLPNIRFHDLRHTFATHALASGVDVKTLSGILGHTRAAFTLDTYTHTTGDMQKRACLAGRMRMREAARRAGVGHSTMHNWISRYRAEGASALSENGNAQKRTYSEALRQKVVAD